MIGGLQMLRGLAATLVVAFHLQAAALNEGFDPGLFRLFAQGEAGVDIFFVLSGFVIFHAAARSPGLTAGGFLAQRFWRIVPPYWAALALTLAALAALAILRGDTGALPDAGGIAVSVLLLPLPGQVMAVAWTLTVEAMFYLLFALTWFRFGAKGALAALALWALMGQIARFWPGGVPEALSLILYSGVVEFLMGALIARANAAGLRSLALPSLLAGAALMAAVVPGVIPLSWGREWVAGLPAAALVYGIVALRPPMPGWALLWGESSYLLYLSHLLVFSILGTALRMVGITPYGHPAGLAALLLLAVALATFATLWLERPYRRRMARPRPARP